MLAIDNHRLVANRFVENVRKEESDLHKTYQKVSLSDQVSSIANFIAIIVCYCLHETAKYILHTINLKNLVSSTKFAANNMADYCIKSTKDLQMLGKLFIGRKLALHKTFFISI